MNYNYKEILDNKNVFFDNILNKSLFEDNKLIDHTEYLRCLEEGEDTTWYIDRWVKGTPGLDDQDEIPQSEEEITKELLDILVCPKSKKPLIYDKNNQELICEESGLIYKIKIRISSSGNIRLTIKLNRHIWVNTII